MRLNFERCFRSFYNISHTSNPSTKSPCSFMPTQEQGKCGYAFTLVHRKFVTTLHIFKTEKMLYSNSYRYVVVFTEKNHNIPNMLLRNIQFSSLWNPSLIRSTSHNLLIFPSIGDTGPNHAQPLVSLYWILLTASHNVEQNKSKFFTSHNHIKFQPDSESQLRTYQPLLSSTCPLLKGRQTVDINVLHKTWGRAALKGFSTARKA